MSVPTHSATHTEPAKDFDFRFFRPIVLPSLHGRLGAWCEVNFGSFICSMSYGHVNTMNHIKCAGVSMFDGLTLMTL